MASAVQTIARPVTQEIISNFMLRLVRLNMQTFSGGANPSTIYDLLVQGGVSVFPYYREIEEKDTAIASALETRRILAMARGTKVHASDSTNGEAQKYADGLSSFLDSIPRFRLAMWELLDAPAYGYSVLEILWKVDPSGISVERLIGRPQELFRFNPLIDPQTGNLMLLPNLAAEAAPIPPMKFIVSGYRQRHGDRRGLPLLRRLFWPSWFKRNALRLYLHFLEKGNGTVIVKYGSSADDAEKDKALEAAEAIATEIAVAVPEGFQLAPEALQATRSRQGSDFKAMVDYFDSELTRMILGQTLATHGSENQRGTMALGEIHAQTMFEYIRNDLDDLETAVNEQLAMPWLLWTFGPQALDRAFRPYWHTDKEPPKDVDSALAQLTSARAMGAKIPALEVYERGQIRMPDDGEEVLPPLQIPASMFQPGQ
jgi:phage gp29-like protein